MPGTILGHLGILPEHIRSFSPGAVLLVGNPAERADFVCLPDPENKAPGSYAPEHGQSLSAIASGIREACAPAGRDLCLR